MAKKDIAQLLIEAKEAIMKDPKVVRALEYNKQPHIFIVDAEKVKAQLLVQIVRTRSRKLTPTQESKLDAAVAKYTKDLYDTFRFRSSKVFDYKVNGSPTSFNVLVTNRDPTTTSDIFRKIYEIRTEAGRLSNLSKSVVEIFSRDASVTQESLKHLFDLGHEEGTSVSERVAQEALNKFSRRNFTMGQYPELDTIIGLGIKTFEQPDGKSFVISVTDESFSANRSKGTKERQDLEVVRKALASWVDQYGTKWISQEGSRSALDIVISNILLTAKKSGAKVNKSKIKKKSAPSSAKTKIVKKSKKPKMLKDVELPSNVSSKVPSTVSRSGSQRANWLQLLPIINARLSDTVAKNMQSPRLNFRTGRFAQSARVVNVEQTSKGFPSFVFDYERDPYDVFDRTLGRAPWNTPQRDPRALVDMSVREIVREMAIGRFFTRRA
jgi:hypothetical protein